ncbi:MAG: S8 family serine peptidase [Bacteroidota bacterium]|nr:S8 family serine peptidase [Bacteroidota bacterium]
MEYANSFDIEEAINLLYKSELIDYAEPHFIQKTLLTPNDPNISSQYHLNLIHAFEAWDICTGDTNVVIGIVDTGTDLGHPDLGNIKYNYNDPIDGKDNDGDGYVDNFYGWDLGENKNNPQWDANASHGVLVTGSASATTNNGIGIAGVGFKCKYLPVKVSNSAGALTKTYEGIVYAADHGCQIINCSWGDSASGYSQYHQDIISYATYNKNSLIVASTGNASNQSIYYPAAYENVISVAGSDQSDVKWTGSSYGITVDITAPGLAIYSTKGGTSYGGYSGTSYSAPIVAGCAALVKSRFPSYNALQIGEQLKVTADNIDTIPGNAAYKGLLGSGRVNIFRALTETNHPSVVMCNINYSDNNDEIFLGNDSIWIGGLFTNYLAPVNNLKASITTSSPYATVINGTISLGNLGTLSHTNNNTNKFIIKLSNNVPVNYNLVIKVTFSDGIGYTSYQYLYLTVNKDYIDLNNGTIKTSITSNGRVGYSKTSMQGGLGVNYKNNDLLYQGQFILATSSVKVLDPNDPYNIVNKVYEVSPGKCSDLDFHATFNDANATTNKIGVSISQNNYFWNSSADNKFYILEYKIKNTSGSPINGLYAGIYADWDIPLNPNTNIASYDANNKLGYEYYSGGVYAGLKLLTKDSATYYAFNNDGSGGSIKIYSNGYTKANKYLSISNGISRANATSGDVSHILGTGPLNIATGDSALVAFAIIVGDNLTDLQTSSAEADKKYNIKLLSPIGGETWNQGSTQIISWYKGVASKINLEVSKDDGITYTTIASNIDGSLGTYNWNIPLGQVAGNKYKIRISDASGFHKDYNTNDFTIKSVTPTISTGNISSNICAGAGITIQYNVTLPFNNGNIFTAQLSDSSGNFKNPLNIGTLSGSVSGKINANIPVSIKGNRYRIRVTGSDPVITGSDNGSDIIITSIPIANAGQDKTICLGNTTTLIATGGDYYSWSNGANSKSIDVSPKYNITYTVTAYATAGCNSTDDATIIIDPANAGTDITTCKGTTVTLNGVGGKSYTWQTGETTPSIKVSPTLTTTYKMTFAGTSGCTGTDNVVVTINNLTADAGTDITICKGDKATLTASGGIYYQWSTGSRNRSIIVTPSLTTTYIVTTKQSFYCSATDNVVVTVNNNLSVDLGADKNICKGSSVTLKGPTGNNYSWSTGETTQNINVTPSVMKIYTLKVTDINGCSASDIIAIKVKSSIVNAGYDKTICNGSSTTLTATGGTNYEWLSDNGQQFITQSITVRPVITTKYTVTSFAGNGCSASKGITVSVITCKNLTEMPLKDFINVYPNPFREQLTIDLQNTDFSSVSDKKLKVTLYNILGIKVNFAEFTLKNGNQKKVLDIKNLPSGVYLMVVDYDNNVNYYKMLKN